MSSQDLVEQLRRQIVFLKNSTSLYDEGCKEEALRIAVAMRVLFHDTKYSISLFQQLGNKDAIQIVTTAKSVPVESVYEIDFGELMGGVTIGESWEYDPIQEGALTISGADWWNEPVFIRNGRLISRKQIVLAAANKDGGAHVGEPDDDLRAGQEGFWISTRVQHDGRTVSGPMVNNHFRMLRRFAEELLKSMPSMSA